MNVSDLDVYMDVLYIVCANYADFAIPTVLVILFSVKKIKPKLIYIQRLRMSHHRLASVTYVGLAQPS
jgi:hypothetical protein